MADIITINTAIVASTIRDVRKTLVRTIAELEAINIEVPASLLLAALLLGHDAADDRRKP
jgi:hypothetical protein